MEAFDAKNEVLRQLEFDTATNDRPDLVVINVRQNIAGSGEPKVAINGTNAARSIDEKVINRDADSAAK
jgi:hypothetical protein